MFQINAMVSVALGGRRFSLIMRLRESGCNCASLQKLYFSAFVPHNALLLYRKRRKRLKIFVGRAIRTQAQKEMLTMIILQKKKKKKQVDQNEQ